MLRTIRSRLALSFTLLIAGLLVVMLALTSWLAYRMLSDLRPRIQSAFEETQTLNEKNVLLNSAGYLGERLFPPLFSLNISGINREIEQIRGWLPIQSFVVADSERRILTDGSRRNPRYGQIVAIPSELLPQQPILTSQPDGSELYFTIGNGDRIAGYAAVRISDVALQTSLTMLDQEVTRLWTAYARSLMLGAGLASLLVALVTSLLIWRLARLASEPISEMIAAAEGIALGNLDIALPVRSDDEVGHLALALNTMAQELKVSQRRMRHLANYDTLTGLPNRHLFQDRLRHATQAADRNGTRLGLLFLDLDEFKSVNDSLGHGLGDEVLKLAARRLRETVRSSDTVARLGGDEFTVIAERVKGPEDVEALATKLLAALELPYRVQDHDLTLSASIGITLYPEGALSPEDLLRNADDAMYQAKRQGKNAYRLFDPKQGASIEKQLSLEQMLHKAIARCEFELHYQPQLDAATGDLIAVETLLRWRNPQELIQPSDFIPLLEDMGLITRLTKWIFSESCDRLTEWRADGLSDLRLAVNLSALQLAQPSLLPTLEDILQATQLPPDALEIEISEQTMLHAEQGEEAVDRLHRLGVRLTVDDFGTGASSLAHLHRFAADTLKIDRSLISEIATDRDSANLTAAAIALSRQLGIQTVAKGVERMEQWRSVREQGCDMVQGHLISKPLQADGFLSWARDHVAKGHEPEHFDRTREPAQEASSNGQD
ncbi:diguanylate cyclase/phosphodiesterase with extracellular sensor [Thiorhodococcus drewsii AZ1]|uniref:Diguanylate cyclase/phosphodiesterase with extracellular sensor n=1 Tax=Thiorhodococcus drewsii AZ1 TaxID=765913 RepID=G2E710_9GAMM|nr:EAL domain-containing protein [Thiorhodococcus drewsii]EGV28110.1 diguanylate cyclase/phosphodiesterase with extracellular sensor [Thiorhodococcus drewsii AZ1]